MKRRRVTALMAALALVVASGWLKKEVIVVPGNALSGKKVLLVIAARNFQDREYTGVRKALEAAGAEVSVASSTTGEAVAMNVFVFVKVKPDLLVRDADAGDYDAVVFIGGPGASEYYDDAAAHALAKGALEKKKVLAAICLAPIVLAKAGLLKGRQATCFGAEGKDILKKEGACVAAGHVASDGPIVTADGPSAASDFANAVAALLKEK